MKKISTSVLLVGIFWYIAATSGNTAVIIAAFIVTLTAFPAWAFVVAKKTGRDPWKWALISILLPLIGPLILAVSARNDIAAVRYKERAEGKKGFWESRFGKFGELIPYVAVLLIVLILAGLAKTGVGIPFFSASASRQPDMSYDVINGNETANLVNGGLYGVGSQADIPSSPQSAELPSQPTPPQVTELPPQLTELPSQPQQSTDVNIPPPPSIDISMIQSALPAPDPGAFDRSNSIFPIAEKAWPDYLPEDIPPIPANIVWLWADPDIVRIQFEGLSLQGLFGYLNLLKENGFDLEYVFYKNPGEILSEDELKELVKQGKFDAVRIKKGKYNFYIEYGMNGGTYDLNVKDFLDPSVINPPKN
jgi:hypothetical protein